MNGAALQGSFSRLPQFFGAASVYYAKSRTERVLCPAEMGLIWGRQALAQDHQLIVGVHGGAHNGGHGLHGAVHGGGDLDLHLHGLQHHQGVAGLHGVAHLALDLEHVAGHGAVHRGLTGGHSSGGGGGRSGSRRGGSGKK